MPVELWPHMRHRMRAYEARGHEWQAIRHKPELVDSLVAEVTERGAVHVARPRRRAAAQEGALGLELVGHQEGHGVPLRLGPARGRRAQQRLRAALRPAGAGDPARAPRGAGADRRGGLGRAAAPGGGGARRRHRVRPARLLPDAARAHQAGAGHARRVRRAAAGAHRGLGPAGLPAPRRRPAPQGARPRPAVPVRPAGLGARAHRAALRLPLPHRDLRPRAQAGARLLRAAVPAR